MTKRVLSIEIGLRKIRICEMDYKKRNPHVYNCIVLDTPKDTTEDGYIRDKNALAIVVKNAIAGEKIKTTDVVFTVSSSKIANREVIIPMVKDQRIQSIVEAGAQDYFPIDVSDYSISYTILERSKAKEDKKLKLLLLAAPNNMIKNYYSFAEAMGMQVVDIDYVGNSFYQLAKKQVGAGVHIAVQINEDYTIINVIENELMSLQRIVPYGANQVIETVLENKVFSCNSEEEAIEQLSREHLINTQFDIENNDIAANFSTSSEAYDRVLNEIRAKEEVTESLRYLVSNITRVLDYYNSKFPDKKIQILYINGLGAQFKGVRHLFRNEIGLETKRIEKLFSVVFSKSINLIAIGETEMICCLGAAIDPIGFLLKELQEKKERKDSVFSMRIIFLLSLVLAAVLIGMSFMSLHSAKTDQNAVNANIEKKNPIEKVFNDFNQAQTEFNVASGFFAMTVRSNEQLRTLIEQLEEKLPKTLKITSISSSEGAITFNVLATSKISAADLLLQLHDIPVLVNATIPAITEAEDESGVKTVTYSVSCQYGVNNQEGQ